MAAEAPTLPMPEFALLYREASDLHPTSVTLREARFASSVFGPDRDCPLDRGAALCIATPKGVLKIDYVGRYEKAVIIYDATTGAYLAEAGTYRPMRSPGPLQIHPAGRPILITAWHKDGPPNARLPWRQCTEWSLLNDKSMGWHDRDVRATGRGQTACTSVVVSTETPFADFGAPGYRPVVMTRNITWTPSRHVTLTDSFRHAARGVASLRVSADPAARDVGWASLPLELFECVVAALFADEVHRMMGADGEPRPAFAIIVADELAKATDEISYEEYFPRFAESWARRDAAIDWVRYEALAQAGVRLAQLETANAPPKPVTAPVKQVHTVEGFDMLI